MTGSKPQISFSHFIITIFLTLLLVACSVVPKNYPPDKAFVFKTNINLEGNFSKEEKSALESQLRNQLHDSMKARVVHKLLYKGVINKAVVEKPPVFDSANADQSVLFMKNLLNSRGYFRNTITYDTSLIIKPDKKSIQYRTTVNFNVRPDNQFKIDSISYVINNTELQAITDVSKHKSTLKKGDPFAQPLISEELNRLVDVYRTNGYLRFSFEELACIWDTLNLAVLRPTIDPFEQIRQLEELKRRRDSPTADIEIRLRPGYDIEKLKKYFVGHTTIYPDYNIVDTTGRIPERVVYDSNFTFVSYRNLFKRKFITQNIYFRKGDLYNQQRFTRTISRFNDIGAWRLVNIESHPRPESDTVDFDLILTPNEKYSFTANIEGSYNNSNSLILAENLFGIGANVQWQNRNQGRSANRSTTTARYSTEVDTKGEFVKTQAASISHTIIFPKPIPNSNWIPTRIRSNVNTGLTFSLGNIENKDFYNITSMNVSWGYNYKWRNQTLNIKLPNIEYAYVRKRDSLIRFLDENPSLRTVFPDNGLVLSLQAKHSIRFGKRNLSQIFKTSVEASGLIFSHVALPIFDSLFKFVKLDLEYIGNVALGKKSFVYRAFTGIGVAMTTKDRPNNPNLPFFKQYSAGGPYSMRAWPIRTLGPGSTVKTRDSVPIRFGDFEFEANLEYRFPLFKIGGYLVSSCLFTDIGNVWFLRQNPDFPDGTISASKFFNDLAVGIGTGLRFDFDFFRLRLDYGLKVKNPSPEPYHIEGQNKWFYNFNPFGGIIQIGVNYPFSF